MRPVNFEPTPNPDALKCVLASPPPPLGGPGGGPGGGLRSYRDPAAAADDPLARALLALPGVAGVFISERFITVTRQSGAKWPAIRKGIERVLSATAEGQAD